MGSLVGKQSLFAIFFLILFASYSVNAFAKGNQYEYETFLGYNNTEDEQSTFQLDQYLMGISIYDLPVVYGDYPYLLTNFFERRTHLDFSFTSTDFESSFDETNGDFYKFNYSFASVGSPVVFNIGVGSLAAEGTDLVGDYDIDALYYFFGFGYYISPNAVANLAVTSIDVELSDDANPDQEYEYDETHIEATWRHILKVDAEQYIALLFDAEAIEIGSSNSSDVGVSFDYFINKRVGFGLGYAVLRGDVGVTEGGELTLSASAFMDGQLGFSAAISRLFADQSGSDEDNLFIKAVIRFE